MPKRMNHPVRTLIWLASFASLAVLATACGEARAPAPETVGCPGGWAIILVGDGVFQSMCGCAEPSTPIASGTFTCTLAKGSQVLFQPTRKNARYQILSTGGTRFASSTLSGANDGTLKSFVVPVPDAGTYEFEDAYQPAVQGRIIAQ